MTNSDGPIDPTEEALSQELLNLVWDLSEGVITESDQECLNELLLQSAANRAAYTEFMQLIAFMEHSHDQSVGGDASDAWWIFDIDASVAEQARLKKPGVIPQPVQRLSVPSRTAPAAAAVACAAVCVLLATCSVFWFVPRAGQPVARSKKETNKETSIAKTDRQQQLIQRNGDELSPENDPLFQKQLEELIQMSSGGP